MPSPRLRRIKKAHLLGKIREKQAGAVEPPAPVAKEEVVEAAVPEPKAAPKAAPKKYAVKKVAKKPAVKKVPKKES
jgi:hypothetical protein